MSIFIRKTEPKYIMVEDAVDVYSSIKHRDSNFSVFNCDNSADKERIIASLASNRDSLSTFAYFLFDSNNIKNATIAETMGTTPDAFVNSLHFSISYKGSTETDTEQNLLLLENQIKFSIIEAKCLTDREVKSLIKTYFESNDIFEVKPATKQKVFGNDNLIYISEKDKEKFEKLKQETGKNECNLLSLLINAYNLKINSKDINE